MTKNIFEVANMKLKVRDIYVSNIKSRTNKLSIKLLASAPDDLKINTTSA